MKGVSVIICSINEEKCGKAVKSIEETIGIDHEIIIFDNNDKKWDICKVYNFSAAKAIYPFLCFMHEDIILSTPLWGKNLVEFHENTKNCGVIGFAGCTITRKNFLRWEVNHGRFRYYDPGIRKPDNNYSFSDLTKKYNNPDNVDFAKVITLDGIFLFTSFKIWKENPFDENIKGFHFYDADFSFCIALKYQNYAFLSADIYHYSAGNYTDSFFINALIFQKKWKYQLPLTVDNEKIGFKDEIYYAHTLYHNLIKAGVSKKDSLSHCKNINGNFITFLVLLFGFLKKIFKAVKR